MDVNCMHFSLVSVCLLLSASRSSIHFINLRAPTLEIPSRLKTGRAEHIVCTMRVSILITQGGNPILIILHFNILTNYL